MHYKFTESVDSVVNKGKHRARRQHWQHGGSPNEQLIRVDKHALRYSSIVTFIGSSGSFPSALMVGYMTGVGSQ